MDWEDFWVEKLKWWLVGLAKTGALLLTLFVIGLIVEVGFWEAQEVFISITAQLVLLAFLIEVLDSWGRAKETDSPHSLQQDTAPEVGVGKFGANT